MIAGRQFFLPLFYTHQKILPASIGLSKKKQKTNKTKKNRPPLGPEEKICPPWIKNPSLVNNGA